MSKAQRAIEHATPAEIDELAGVPPWPTLDDAALTGLAGDIVHLIEPHTESDPVALLTQIICAFGNTIGRNAYYQVEADRHYTNLFIVLVGRTSKGRKGTSRAQVMNVFRSADERWESRCTQSGLSSGEGLIWAVRDPIEKSEPIKDKNRVVGYQTVIIDAGIEDKRLLVEEPEFASILKRIAGEGNTLSAVMRTAWDTGRLRVLTKNSPAHATDAHISIIGHVTQEELCRYLNSTEAANGFANRFLWLCVKRSKILPEGGHIQDVDFGKILKRLGTAIDFGRKSTRIQWSKPGQKKWHEVYPELSEGKPGLLGAVTSRAEAQVVRLALIYALLDGSALIQKSHLEAALALWEYAEYSARYIFGDALGDPLADELLAAIRANVTGLTRTQISNLFSRNQKAEHISRALSMLVEDGKIRPEYIEETGGRRAQVFLAI